MAAPVLKVHPSDNVIVALTDLPKGTQVPFEGTTYTLTDDIPAKHKFVTEALPIGGEVIMYGVLVGKASQPIALGGLIHTGNLKHAASPYSGKSKEYTWQAPDASAFAGRTFQGYPRPNGQFGTANYWLFVPTVFCENRNLEFIREALLKELGYDKTEKYQGFAHQLVERYKQGASADELVSAPATLHEEILSNKRLFPNVDGIKFLTHQGGCGGTRQDAGALAGLLAGYITHPNVAGVTVLSLGCQHMQVAELMEEIHKRDPHFAKPLYVFEQQQEGTEETIMTKAIAQTFAGLIEANKITRQPAPLSHITLGVKCGGSDGFSGISANPALGHAADLLVALGGKVLMAEFPELNGVEQELADRSVSAETADKFVTLMRKYSDWAKSVGSGFDANPSPGNIRDGLITDAIKSAGAAKKGGTSPVVDVLDYTEVATKPGLSLVCTPGNDVEATTGKTAAGANVIVFTTGLGTPTGNPICPVLKVSTNTALAQRMPDIIDLDTGTIITGEDTIESMGEKLLDLVIRTASGEHVPASVRLGQDDFIPWKRGVSL